MTDIENKLVEKILEKLDMDKLTDKIAERAAELIIQKEYSTNPNTPFSPSTPYIPNPHRPFDIPVLMYGATPTEFGTTCDPDNGISKSASID